MKVCVINRSGNVGKTTICKDLLLPNMPEAKLARFEDINASSGEASIELSAEKLPAFLEAIALEVADFVIDIGGSNAKGIEDHMTEMQGAINDFEFFVLPCIAEFKARADTIRTAEALIQLGVPPEHIVVIHNKIPVAQYGERHSMIGDVVAHAEANGYRVLDAGLVLSDAFEITFKSGIPLQELALKDPNEYKMMAREAKGAGDSAKAEGLVRLMTATRLAKTAVKCLDDAWSELSVAMAK